MEKHCMNRYAVSLFFQQYHFFTEKDKKSCNVFDFSEISFCSIYQSIIVQIYSQHVLVQDLIGFQNELFSNHFGYCVQKTNLWEGRERIKYSYDQKAQKFWP